MSKMINIVLKYAQNRADMFIIGAETARNRAQISLNRSEKKCGSNLAQNDQNRPIMDKNG